MLLFLKKLGLFFLLAFAVWFALYGSSKTIDRAYLSKEYSNLSTLVLGDSHTKYINELVLPNAENLSYEGETFKEAYYKLKYFSQFNKLNDVVLGVSYHNFTYLTEYKIRTDYHSINRIASISSIQELFKSTDSFADFIDVATRLHMPQTADNWFYTDNSRASLIDRNITYRDVERMKKNPKRKVNCKKIVDRRIQKHYYYHNNAEYRSKSAEEYLSAIISHCQTHNINLIFVNMPLHPCYRSKIPEYYINNLNAVINQYRQNDHVSYLDYTDQFDMLKTYFRDADHCTEYGSHVITEQLLEEIKRG